GVAPAAGVGMVGLPQLAATVLGGRPPIIDMGGGRGVWGGRGGRGGERQVDGRRGGRGGRRSVLAFQLSVHAAAGRRLYRKVAVGVVAIGIGRARELRGEGRRRRNHGHHGGQERACQEQGDCTTRST